MATGTAIPAATPRRATLQVIDEQIGRTKRHLRIVDVLCSLAVLAVGALSFLLVAAVIDHWIAPLGYAGRTLAFLGLVGGSAYYLAAHLAPLLLRTINPTFAAHAIEESQPKLKNSLVNFFLLRGDHRGVREAVLDAMEQRAAADIAVVPVDSAIDRSHLIRIGYVLVGVLALIAFYKILSPKDPFQSAARVIAPWANIARPARVRITDVQPGSIELYHGQTVKVSAAVDGVREGGAVKLLYTTADGQTVNREIPMAAIQSGLRYECELPPPEPAQTLHGKAGLQQDLTYRIVAGDAETSDFKLTVTSAPTIIVQKTEYQFPPYTKKSPQTVEGGDIRGLEGTKVAIQALANQPIQTAVIEFDPAENTAAAPSAETVAMQVDGDRAWGTVTLRLKPDHATPWHTRYQVRFTNRQQQQSEQPIIHRLEVDPDLPPEVQILSPQKKRVEVAEDGMLPLEVRGVDPDFGLSSLKLRARAGGKTVLDKELLPAAGQPPQANVKFEFRPREQHLSAGTEVVYQAIAADNRTAPVTGEPDPNITATEEYSIKILAPAADKNPRNQPGDPPPDKPQADKPPPGKESPPAAGKEKPPAGEKSGNKQDPGEQKNPEKNPPDDKQPPTANEQPNPGEKSDSSKAQESNSAPKESSSAPKESGKGGGAAKENQKNEPMQSAGGDDDQRADSQENGAGSQKGGSGSKSQSGGKQQSGGGNQSGQNPSGEPQDGSGENSSGADQQTGGKQAGGKQGAKPSAGQSSQDPSAAENEAGESGGAGQAKSGPGKKKETHDGDVFDQILKDREEKQKKSGQPADSAKPGEKPLGKPMGENNAEGNPQDQPAEQPNGGEKSGEKSTGQPAGAESKAQPTGDQGAEKSGAEKTGAGKEGTGKEGQTNPGKSNPGKSKEGDSKEGKSKEGNASSGNASSGKTAEASGKKPDAGKPNGAAGKAGGDEEKSKGNGPTEKAEGDQGGKSDGRDKTDAGKKSPQGTGEKQSDKKAPGQGTNGASGAGQNSTDKTGSGEPMDANQDRPKNPGQDGAKPEDGSPSPPSESKKQSSSKGGDSGDKSGGGKKGAGQSAGQEGNDSAGSKSAADEGAGAAEQQGKGETGKKPGDQQKSSDPTGKPGTEKGAGSGSKASAQGKSGEGAPGEKTDSQNQSASGANGEPGKGSGVPKGGGLQGDGSTGDGQVHGEVPDGDAANLEYSRKATQLALQHLRDQKDQPDPNLLDRLGWTKEDLAEFLRRWDTLEKSAQHDAKAAGELEESLKSLGLRPSTNKKRVGDGKNDNHRDLRDSGNRATAPARYREQFEQFRRSAAKGKAG